jgi:hypothetical protein
MTWILSDMHISLLEIHMKILQIIIPEEVQKLAYSKKEKKKKQKKEKKGGCYTCY